MTIGARQRVSERGVTLLESLVALTLLLVGILGTMRLQIFGITSDSGARAHTRALQLARELAAGLEKLETFDAPLAPHYTGATPPPELRSMLQSDGTPVTTGFTAWSDAAPIAGVTPDAALFATDGADPADDTHPLFQRRWSVWQSESAATVGGVKLVAVYVIYSERALPGHREVVLLTQVSNTGLSSAFASAYR
jgi:Tfp pilus assembly protein PilV